MNTPETSSRPRVARGVPTGGQFAADRREEPDVRLHRSDLEDRLNSALGEPGAQVLDALTRAGGHPYLVGGCVRDGLLGLDPKDVDIEVYGLTVEQVGAALEPLGDVSEVGASFAITTVRVDGHDFDVALPRAETKNGPGHTGFEVTANPHAPTLEASARRDFTINAMMFDPAAAELVDHWGGQRDLEGRVLRHTTSAFADDPLRVLRGARFAARFDMTMHPDTVALARSIAGEFHTLPVERVWSEWRSLASTATHPSRALQVLADTGWEQHFPVIARLHGVPQDPAWHPEGDVWVHSGLSADAAARLAADAGMVGDERAMVVLAAMLHDVGKHDHTLDENGRITSPAHAAGGVEPAAGFLRGIGAPASFVERIRPIVANHMVATGAGGSPSPAAVRRLGRRLEPATIEQWALVCEADKGGRGTASTSGHTAAWVAQAREEQVEVRPAPGILRGTHLIDAGLTPGPSFSLLIARALEAQDNGDFDDDAGARAWLQQHLSSPHIYQA